MIIFCNCHLNLNNFQIVCHKATFQENVTGFQIQIWLAVMKQDIISYMSRTSGLKACLTHSGRQLNRKINYRSILLWNIRYYYENLANYYSHYDNYFFNMLFQQQHINMQLDAVYWCTVFNGKTSLWKFFTHICIKQNGISNNFVIYCMT